MYGCRSSYTFSKVFALYKRQLVNETALEVLFLLHQKKKNQKIKKLCEKGRKKCFGLTSQVLRIESNKI